MKKLNIAEILKDCPKGMELNCTCADNVVFDKIIEYEEIKCVIGESREPLILDKYGRLLHICCPKCVIFPKGKTTWEGFEPPCRFKDGDVVVCVEDNEEGKEEATQIFILKSQTGKNNGFCYTGYDFVTNKFFNARTWHFDRLATEEEKQKLFDAIKANGYKWNPETKTLEKLPKFKVGDRVKHKDGYFSGVVTKIYNGCYKIEYDDETVVVINIKEQDEWELVPNKFDITTLRPFDKVLVRDNDKIYWSTDIYSHHLGKDKLYQFMCIGSALVKQCIPYEENKHLLGTTNNCDEYYKTWE